MTEIFTVGGLYPQQVQASWAYWFYSRGRTKGSTWPSRLDVGPTTPSPKTGSCYRKFNNCFKHITVPIADSSNPGSTNPPDETLQQGVWENLGPKAKIHQRWNEMCTPCMKRELAQVTSEIWRYKLDNWWVSMDGFYTPSLILAWETALWFTVPVSSIRTSTNSPGNHLMVLQLTRITTS